MKQMQKASFNSNSSDIPQFKSKLDKQPQQFKALFLKNLRLQSKQVGTNICQILTPIICLLFAYVMLTVAKGGMPMGQLYKPNLYPYWFNDHKIVDQNLKNISYSRAKLQWYLYQCQTKNCNEEMLGINNGTYRKSMLGNVSQSFNGFVDFKPNPFEQRDRIQKVTVPFFRTFSQNQTLNQNLFKRLETLPKQSNQYITKYGGLNYLPDGAINFQTLNQNKLKAKLYINDVRELQFHYYNGISVIVDMRKIGNNSVRWVEYTPAYGLLGVADIVASSYFSQLPSVRDKLQSFKSGFILMPDVEGQATLVDTFINIVGALIFPIALGLLFPVFLYTIVLQKQQKLIQMMKMNGMKISSYWGVYFIFNFVFGFITNLIFFLMGYFMVDISFFTQTSFFLMFLVQLGWLLAQIGLAVFFQTFLSKSRSANILGYLISIWFMMIGSTLNIGVYQYPTQMPMALRMIPPFAFVRLFYLMLSGCSDSRCYTQIGFITDEMKDCILFLYVSFIVFFALGAYLYQIIPQQFGVTQSPLFPFKMIWKLLTCKLLKEEQSQNTICQDTQLRNYIGRNKQDDLAKKQRQTVWNLKGQLGQYPLIINNLRKIYQKDGMDEPFVAVKCFNLKVASREVFGLLGPNGAGKTTLISMITGMFKPNNGNAWIGGHDIKTDVSIAQLEMGVCPQFDLLWPQLTVEQHLYFYARLKGVPGEYLKRKVQEAIQQVKLTKFTKFVASSLSGGMKRRLSVAISLVGNPQIVFLDEPSTGLDPENRRQLWQVLSKCQKKRAIFLTTHMMQEADTLCNRIGIITNGVLRTVGPSLSLKKKYGGGYRLSLNVKRQQRTLVNRDILGNQVQPGHNVVDYDEQNSEQEQKHNNKLQESINSFIQLQESQYKFKLDKRNRAIKQFIENRFKNSQLTKVFNGTLLFKVPLTYKVSQLFQQFEKIQDQLEIADIAITNSSLEDVFMNVVVKFDNSQDNDNQQLKNSLNQSIQKSFKQSIKDKKNPKQDKFGSIMSKKRQSVASNENHPLKNEEKVDQEGYSVHQDEAEQKKSRGSNEQ